MRTLRFGRQQTLTYIVGMDVVHTRKGAFGNLYEPSFLMNAGRLLSG